MNKQRNHKARLNKNYVDKLNLTTERFEVTDDKLPGFKLRVGQTKKTYILRYRFGKIRRTHTIGDHGAWTPEQARKEAQRLLREIDQGCDPSTQKTALKNAPTFKQLTIDYLANSTKLSIKDDESKINNFLLPCWGKRQAFSITTKDISMLLKTLLDKGRTPATYNRYLALIKVIFNKAVEWKLISSNPAKHIKPLEENNSREVFLSQAQVSRLLLALNDAPNNAANAIRLALFTGQRIGNVMSAKWEDLSEDFWLIPKTKSGKRHRVPLSPEARGVLTAQHNNHTNNYIFPGKHGKPHIISVQKIWDKVRKQANLANVRLHDLRHTYASWAISSGASIYDVQKLLGHSDIKMTQRYAHIADDWQHKVAKNTTANMVVNINDYAKKQIA